MPRAAHAKRLGFVETEHADDEISFIRHLSVMQRTKKQGRYGGSP